MFDKKEFANIIFQAPKVLLIFSIFVSGVLGGIFWERSHGHKGATGASAAYDYVIENKYGTLTWTALKTTDDTMKMDEEKRLKIEPIEHDILEMFALLYGTSTDVGLGDLELRKHMALAILYAIGKAAEYNGAIIEEWKKRKTLKYVMPERLKKKMKEFSAKRFQTTHGGVVSHR